MFFCLHAFGLDALSAGLDAGYAVGLIIGGSFRVAAHHPAPLTSRRVVVAKVDFGPRQFHHTLVGPLSHAPLQLPPRDLDACIPTGDFRRDSSKPPPPSEVEALAVVAGHSPKYFFQDAADSDTIYRIVTCTSRYPLTEIKIGYQRHKQRGISYVLLYSTFLS